jgi:acyl-CoA synthetase (NDP forming)
MDTEMSGTNENTPRKANEDTPRNTNDDAPRDALDKEMALARASDHEEMRQWAKGLKINKPIPADLLPILAKDGAKQTEIVMKNMSLERQEN